VGLNYLQSLNQPEMSHVESRHLGSMFERRCGNNQIVRTDPVFFIPAPRTKSDYPIL
jgi:hypothetical protein